MVLSAIILFTLSTYLISDVHGHGRLIEPPSRASAWRYGFNTPHNYNDHELYCGGFTRQWVKNDGKCGICGDAWDTKKPRPHDFGGTYGQGVIVRQYSAGSNIVIRIELTASHMGYFEFGICPNYKNPTQECIDKNLLHLVRPQENVEHQGTRYFPKEGNKVYEMKYVLPKKTCEHCLLQWRYIAGNNWGNCPNGTGAVGCGPQEEFRACADISITSKSSSEEPFSTEEPDITPNEPYGPSSAKPTTLRPMLPTPDETYNPISTLIISLVSFLVVFSTFFLLYFHFYQVGRQIKNWIKGGPGKKELSSSSSSQQPPQVPPRLRRAKSPSADKYKEDFMHEIDLKADSPA